MQGQESATIIRKMKKKSRAEWNENFISHRIVPHALFFFISLSIISMFMSLQLAHIQLKLKAWNFQFFPIHSLHYESFHSCSQTDWEYRVHFAVNCSTFHIAYSRLIPMKKTIQVWLIIIQLLEESHSRVARTPWDG
jgi:hypothetical protein